MLALALPVIIAEIGWITMGIVDTIIVGPLGPAALGAVGTGSTLFFTVMVLGMGTLFALDAFVAQSFGAGRIDDCHRWLFAGLQLAGVMSVVLVLIAIFRRRAAAACRPPSRGARVSAAVPEGTCCGRRRRFWCSPSSGAISRR